MKYVRAIVIITVFVGGCFATERLGSRRLDPAGRVSNLSEYLAWRPSAEQFAAVEINGKQHVIAYGPMSSWLLLSSGSSAYVFDETARLRAPRGLVIRHRR